MPMYKLLPNNISSKLGKNTTVLNHQVGIYYGLNQVGTVVWETLRQSPASFDDLKSVIINKFEVDENTCSEDLKNILTDLMNAKLIEKIS